MTDKEKVARWRNRIRIAQEKRRIFFEGRGEPGTATWEPGADFAIDAYRGKLKPDWWCTEDPWVNIGKVKSAIRASLPSLLYNNPEYRVEPSAHDIAVGPDGQQADIAYERSQSKAAWLNHTFAESNGMVHARNAIQNAFVSLGVIKGGYLCHFQDDKKRGVFARDDNGEFVLDENGDPELERGEYLEDDGELLRDADGIPIPHPGRLTKEEWFIESVDPKMMLFDVESGLDFFQHRYVIEEWVRPLEQVKADPRFPKSLRDRLRATETVYGLSTKNKSVFEIARADAASDGTGMAVQNDEGRVRGYDIYDFENNEYLVLTEASLEHGPMRDTSGRFKPSTGKPSNDNFLLEDDMPDGMEHGPYRFLKFTEDMGTEWYPIPDAIDMAIVNREYNITRSQMMIHREHTKTRYMELPGAYNVDGVDPEEERTKWAHGPDGCSIRVSGPAAIQPAPKPQLDGSFFQAIPNIQGDFAEVSGMPGESRGVADSETATQASILATGNEVRNNDRRDNQIHKFLCEIGRMLLMSGQANAELDTLVIQRVTERTGVPPFKAVKITPQELKGEFDVTVAIGSMLPKNDPRVLQQLMTFFNALAQNPAIGMMKGLIRRILDGMGLDPLLADEIYDIAMQITQMQMAPKQTENNNPNSGQTLGDTVMGLLGNAAGGSPTGAPIQ